MHFQFVVSLLVLALTLCFSMATATESETSTTKQKYLTADNVTTCQENSADLGECLKNLFNAIMPTLKDGNEELNIPPFEPYLVPRTVFEYKNGALSGRVAIKNTKMHGLSKLRQVKLDVKTLDDKRLEINHTEFVPKMYITGNYKGEITFNDIHLKPKGAFNLTLSNITITLFSKSELYEKDGHRFIRLVDFETYPDISDLKVNVTGIFDDKPLNDLAVDIANDLWREVYKIMLPQTRSYWGPLLIKIVNTAFSSIPYDNFVKKN